MEDVSRARVASVVGVASDTRWGQVLVTPHAYGVVEVYSPDGIAKVRGIQTLTKLTRLFLTPPVSLSKLSVIADSMMNEDIVSLTLLVPIGDTLYLVLRGSGCVYLKREEKLAKLLEEPGSLSGSVTAGDTVIAANSGFIATLTPEEILGAFDHLAPSDVAEKLSLRLHEHVPGGDSAAALIFKIEGESDEGMKEGEQGRETQPPKTSQTIFLSRVKTMGRRVTTPAIRFFLRRTISRLKGERFFSARHLLVYSVITLFCLSVVLGLRREYVQRGRSTIAETMRQAKFSFDEGMALLELNPVKGRERLTQARDVLSPVIAKKQQSREAREAKVLYDEIVTNLTRAMHITTVTPELYFDMSLLKQGATATDFSLFDSTIGVVDSKGTTAFTIGVSPKTAVIVGGGVALSGMSHAAAYGDKLYVWTPAGIHQIRLSDQKTVPNVVSVSGEWGTIVDMAAFGGNLYLLDTGKSRIWKYVATENARVASASGLSAGGQGFSQLFEYLNPDTLPDLSKTTNMVIDGSVWLGTTTGHILRFTGGKETSFVLQGADTQLGKFLLVYTDADAKMLYVLDRDNSRVVVFDKDGLYMAQYVWSKDFQPVNLVVSEKAGKIFLLRDGRIYSIDLK